MIRNALVERVNRSPTIDGQVYDAVGIPFKLGLVFHTSRVAWNVLKKLSSNQKTTTIATVVV